MRDHHGEAGSFVKARPDIRRQRETPLTGNEERQRTNTRALTSRSDQQVGLFPQLRPTINQAHLHRYRSNAAFPEASVWLPASNRCQTLTRGFNYLAGVLSRVAALISDIVCRRVIARITMSWLRHFLYHQPDGLSPSKTLRQNCCSLVKHTFPTTQAFGNLVVISRYYPPIVLRRKDGEMAARDRSLLDVKVDVRTPSPATPSLIHTPTAARLRHAAITSTNPALTYSLRA